MTSSAACEKTEPLGRTLVMAAMALLVLAGALPAFMLPMNADVGWLLYVAMQVLEGARLYVDFVEVNPPLAIYLSIPPALVARLLDTSTVWVFYAYVTALILAVLLMCRSLLRLLPNFSIRDRYAFYLLLVFILFPLSRGHFGQREHFALAFVAPYLIAAAIRGSNQPIPQRLAVGVGVVAGIGFALKPYFLLPWVLVELSLFVRLPSHLYWRRPESYALCVLGLVYASSILVLTPAYLQLVPTFSQVYHGFNATLPDLLTATALWWSGVVAVALFLVPSKERWREIRRTCLAAKIGFLLAALVQQKGWSYHFYPALGLAMLLAGIVALEIAERLTRSRIIRLSRSTLAGGIIVALLLGAGGITARTFMHAARDTAVFVELENLATTHAQGASILFFSTSLSPAFPVVNHSGVRWGSRFPSLWPLPGIYSDVNSSTPTFPYHDLQNATDLERGFIAAVTDDFERNRPALLVVDTSQWKQGFNMTSFDYIEYFIRDPRFAQLMRAYIPMGVVGSFRLYKYSEPKTETD